MKELFILQVEDSPDDAELMQHALRKAEIRARVEVARDGVEALEFISGEKYAGRDAGERPAFVLLDLKLPRVDGFEVLKGIRANKATAHLPVVVFTSSAEEKDISRAYELGVNSYVRKPVDFTRFAEAVRQIAAYWMSLNVAPGEPLRQRTTTQN